MIFSTCVHISYDMSHISDPISFISYLISHILYLMLIVNLLPWKCVDTEPRMVDVLQFGTAWTLYLRFRFRCMYCLKSRLDFHSGGFILCCDLKSYFGKGPIDSFRWSLPSSAVFSSAHNEKKAYLFLNWYRFWWAALFLWSQEPSAPPC